MSPFFVINYKSLSSNISSGTSVFFLLLFSGCECHHQVQNTKKNCQNRNFYVSCCNLKKVSLKMEVFKFEKSLLTRLTETRDVLCWKDEGISAARVKYEWKYFIEIQAEPTGNFFCPYNRSDDKLILLNSHPSFRLASLVENSKNYL